MNLYDQHVLPHLIDFACGMGQVMNTLRLALVGAGKGPGMYDVTSFIGKEETLRRIDNLLTNLKPAIE